MYMVKCLENKTKRGENAVLWLKIDSGFSTYFHPELFTFLPKQKKLLHPTNEEIRVLLYDLDICSLYYFIIMTSLEVLFQRRKGMYFLGSQIRTVCSKDVCGLALLGNNKIGNVDFLRAG